MDGPLLIWDMLLIGIDVQEDVGFRNIRMEWVELRIHFDNFISETAYIIGVLDHIRSIDQVRNAKFFETLNGTKMRLRQMEKSKGIILKSITSLIKLTYQ